MSYELIKAKIKTILEGVSGIGIVHDYERWTVRPEKFIELFKDSNDKINGWEITRQATTELRETTGPRFIRIYSFLIFGYYALKDEDATEKVFDGIMENICTAFRSNYDLDGLAQKQELIQIDVAEPRMFSDYLCHYVEMSLVVYEELSS